MLRGIGLALIVFGALGVFAALQAIAYRLLDKSADYGLIDGVCSGAYAACGMAAGMLLTKRTPLRRGSLFWIALLGACVCTPLALLQIVTRIYWALQNGDALAVAATLFLAPAAGRGWWPPQEVLFLNTLMFATPIAESYLWYGKPLHEPFLWISGVAFSPLLWIYFPLALCLWAMFGRRSPWADRFFALSALILVALLMSSAVEIAWVYYQQSTFKPGPEDAIDYLYIPRLSWFVFYAIAALWLAAFAALLSRRRADPAKAVAS